MGLNWEATGEDRTDDNADRWDLGITIGRPATTYWTKREILREIYAIGCAAIVLGAIIGAIVALI